MAEAVLFSIASNLLSKISSPLFEKAYNRVRSIYDAMVELDKLKESIQTIHAVLLDAEKKQDSSAAVKAWIERVSDVLHEAEDLFDEVATDHMRDRRDDMLKQPDIKKKNRLLILFNKVHVCFSSSNPIIVRDSIAQKVNAIRMSLVQISTDMKPFKFVKCQHEVPVNGFRKRQDPGFFVDSKNVIGRDQDKKAILDWLSDNAKSDATLVIAIVGIGGMGKTTLAQLIYNHEEVEKTFKKKWFACISDTSDEKEVFGKIYQSMCNKDYNGCTVGYLQSEIQLSMKGNDNFLLILDDVWDEDHGRWEHRMSLLSKGLKGGKIIVTTRSLSVAQAVGASKTHNLYGLSDDESWDLFKRLAFTPEQEKNPRWTALGREIVKKCANVPLAIMSIGSLLYIKSTIQEWESFRDQGLSKLDEQNGDGTMNALKLSYDYLPSNLKHCFAYCSLFPKDFQFEVKGLIYCWISQGFIQPRDEMQRVEAEGQSCFMDLFRRSFFQGAVYNVLGDILWCKMHDVVHDLAQRVAGEKIVMLSGSSDQLKRARHVGVFCRMEKSWEVLAQPLTRDRVRSIMIARSFLLAGEPQFKDFKHLRMLSLRDLDIQKVSPCIGELNHLRYIDLSCNKFTELPESMVNLLNLQVLSLAGCTQLDALPDKFCKLINLRCLNLVGCSCLIHMPPRMEQLTCLQYLSDFKVRRAIEGLSVSGIDALAGMQQLRGNLSIKFSSAVGKFATGSLQLPNHLESLSMEGCNYVEDLSTIIWPRNLKYLYFDRMSDLEYVEDEGSCIEAVAGSSSTNASTFFPHLEFLELKDLPNLKGWRRKNDLIEFPSLSKLRIERCEKLQSIPSCPNLSDLRIEGCEKLQSIPSFPNLSNLWIKHCKMLQSISPCPSLRELHLSGQIEAVTEVLQEWNCSNVQKIELSKLSGLTSFSDKRLTSLRHLKVDECPNLEYLHLTSPELQIITTRDCDALRRFQVEKLPNLTYLKIRRCKKLKYFYFKNLHALEDLLIRECPKLKLWEEDPDTRYHIDWVSLPNLCKLNSDTFPPPEKLPKCLQHRHDLGKLQLSEHWY